MDEGETNCICGSTEAIGSMICCDSCGIWFHLGCMEMTAAESAALAHFFCPKCKEAKPRDRANSDSAAARMVSSKSKSEAHCGRCINCFRDKSMEDCGKCASCKDSKEFGGANQSRSKCLSRVCVYSKKGNSAVLNAPNVPAPIKKSAGRGRPRKILKNSNSSPAISHLERKPNKTAGRKGPAKNIGSAAPLKGTRQASKKFQQFLQDAGVEVESAAVEQIVDRQCYGPGCVNYAVDGSKYCSQACGVNLAKNRILELLPSRIRDWKLSPSVAGSHQQTQLDKIEVRRAAVKQRLDQLAKDEADLKEWKEAAQRIEADSDEEGSDGESDESEQTLYCITCAQEISIKTALKHIVRCAGKFESQTSYGTSHPTPNNMFDLFCDVYNKASQTYCKRLKIICPEHSKEEKILDSEICAAPVVFGQPLVNFRADPKSVCLVAKKRCAKHYWWERTRRALVAQERLNLLLKLEEMFEEERNIRAAMDNRGSLMALLLHSISAEQVDSRNTTV